MGDERFVEKSRRNGMREIRNLPILSIVSLPQVWIEYILLLKIVAYNSFIVDRLISDDDDADLGFLRRVARECPFVGRHNVVGRETWLTFIW